MKRRDKPTYEWKKQYQEKHELMIERGYEEVDPYTFYRELFPAGSLQEKGTIDDGRGNIVASQIRLSGQGRTRQWVVTDDLQMLDKVIGDPFGLIAPISYYGITHSKRMAHDLFALAIDIDYVGKQQLKNLLRQFSDGIQLMPTYLISSGKGVHVYYFLNEPIELYHNRSALLDEIKHAFIGVLWKDTTSLRPDEPDITGIYQAFRCVGSQSKLGADYPVRAYKISDNRYSINDFIEFLATNKEIKISAATSTAKVSLAQAKKLYPEWYQERIVEGKPKVDRHDRKTWTCNVALYEWWKRKIRADASMGGRYYSIVALCAYGLKCGVSDWHIRRDAYELLDYLESLTDDDTNHFTRADIKDALKFLKADRRQLTQLITREWIEQNTKIAIPKNKRNGRTRQAHARYVTNQRLFKASEGECILGRHDKSDVVRAWRKAHPNGRKIDCERDTGLSRHTVLKWWDA